MPTYRTDFLKVAFYFFILLGATLFFANWYYSSQSGSNIGTGASAPTPLRPKGSSLHIRLLDQNGNILYSRFVVIDNEQRIVWEGKEEIKQIVIQNW